MADAGLAAYSLPLDTVDPAAPDQSALVAFDDVIGDARIVSVGESAHGVRDFIRFKDRLFRYLVRNHGITAFVLESGFAEALAVNEWILGGPGEIEAIAPEGICWTFDTEELRDQFRWMRAWNAQTDQKVRFYGLDVAGSNAKPRPALAAALSRLDPAPGDEDLLKAAQLGERFQVPRIYAAQSLEARERLWAGVADVRARAAAKGDSIATRCIDAVLVIRPMIEGEPFGGVGPGRNPRDAFMAETVKWILEREERIMISAHNAHVSRGHLMGIPMLGEFLLPDLGTQMVVIGTTYAEGSVIHVDKWTEPGEWRIDMRSLPAPPHHTLDAAMDRAAPDLHLVDLHKVPDAAIADRTAMLLHHEIVPMDPRGFDALVHFRHVATAAGAFEQIAHEVELGRAEKPATGDST